MNDSDKPKVNPAFTVEKFDDEILLYSEKTTQAVYLNDTAHVVLALCQEDLSVSEMVQYLEQAYPDQKEEIRDDVIAALKTLQDQDVIFFEDDK